MDLIIVLSFIIPMLLIVSKLVDMKDFKVSEYTEEELWYDSIDNANEAKICAFTDICDEFPVNYAIRKNLFDINEDINLE